ncbi:hypothetical protein QYF61_015796 [Mycteria americana]|uniref:Immunoglobulin C1-set domain-containing protein n=1 Tax=Mycteria americana TaxID=33587 RepID=A0AAN7P4T8_MYCAM|nr:hypothetical protein QYF61_015796 [Mycteria americana]
MKPGAMETQEESAPEIIVLKSKEPKKYNNKLNMACLARSFYPKNISLDMFKSNIVYYLKAPLVTCDGMYSTMKIVRLEPDAEVTCKAMHKGNKTVTSIILPEEKTEEFETVNACNTTEAPTKGTGPALQTFVAQFILVSPSQMQNLAVLVKYRATHDSQMLQYVQIFLQGLLSLTRVNSISQFSIINKIMYGLLNSFIQIIGKYIEQNWPEIQHEELC